MKSDQMGRFIPAKLKVFGENYASFSDSGYFLGFMRPSNYEFPAAKY